MEAFALYLFKSVVWLSGFALVYLLFLRNERFFHLNRLYLVSGILISFFFPFFTVHYAIDLPATGEIEAGNVMVSGFQKASHSNIPDTGLLLMMLYISGVLFVAFMIIKQSRSVLKALRKSEIITSHPVKLIRTSEYPSSFSFFSYVFVNPSLTDIETKEIVNHELVHIRQWHWLDLVLVQLLCMLQWFNPFIWIYIRLMRQNHEYLADEVALQRTLDPAIYRATLLNQIVGSPVVSVANSFNYSLNKKRFNMMKNIITSPYRKMKIFLILPVFALVLYAFAKPEYKYNTSGNNTGNQDQVSTVQAKELKGTVMQQDGKPLQGATLIIKGTTIGTLSDEKGYFRLTNVPDAAPLVVSFVGFKSKVIKPVYTSDMIIQMVRDTVKLGSISTNVPPPPPPPVDKVMQDKNSDADVSPPPPPPPPFDLHGTGTHPLIILDGKITDIDPSKMDPAIIESISVLKGENATKKYGEKGKNGVIEMTSKKKDVYNMVEEMPQFPGGESALMTWISANIKYPDDAVKKNITGEVYVNFILDRNGKIKDVKVDQPINPLLDAEAVRVISSMPDWKPGMQGGKPVDVNMKIPIVFNLK